MVPFVQQLEKRGSRAFRSVHFVKYATPYDILKRNVIRERTKKTMTRMLTQSHIQMQNTKPQETAMKEISHIKNKDKNLILATKQDLEPLVEIVREKPNY